MSEREQAEERRLDWAFGEAVRGEQAPDVVEAVLARRRAAAAAPTHHSRTRWLAAALVLLGVGVVATLLLRGPTAAVDEAQEPQAVQIYELQQIDGLPPETAAVALLGLGDRAVERLLARCPELTFLSVRSATLGEDVGHALRLGATSLREVRLVGCKNVNDVTVAELCGMPSLRTIRLGGTSVSEHSEPLLRAARQLRTIDLGEAPWFTLTMAQRIARLGKRIVVSRPHDPEFERRLAGLMLRYERWLDRPYYHQVRTVEDLDALPQSTTHIELRGLGDEAVRHLIGRRRLVGIDFVRDDNDPFTAASMPLLARMTWLEELRLNNVMQWDGQGLDALATLKSLRALELSSVPVDDAGLAVLPKLAALRDLKLVGVRRFGSEGMRIIAGLRELTALELMGCDQLSDRQLALLGPLTKLRRLDLSRTKAGNQAITALASMRELRRLELEGVAFDSEAAHAFAGMHHLLRLNLGRTTKLDNDALNSLPVSLRDLRIPGDPGLDQGACSILRDRFVNLNQLAINGAPWLDDAGLRVLLQNPAIEVLEINACSGVTSASYATVRDCRHLRDLSARFCGVLDDETEKTLRRERPDLRLDRSVW